MAAEKKTTLLLACKYACFHSLLLRYAAMLKYMKG